MLGSIVIVTGLRFIWFRRSRKTGNQCAAGAYGAGADFPQSLCGINAVKRRSGGDFLTVPRRGNYFPIQRACQNQTTTQHSGRGLKRRSKGAVREIPTLTGGDYERSGLCSDVVDLKRLGLSDANHLGIITPPLEEHQAAKGECLFSRTARGQPSFIIVDCMN